MPPRTTFVVPWPAISAAARATTRSSRPWRQRSPARRVEGPMDTATRELKIVGKRVPRVDAKERVTGRAIYPADFSLPGMLHGRIKRSPHPHARLLKVDVSKALALKGV